MMLCSPYNNYHPGERGVKQLTYYLSIPRQSKLVDSFGALIRAKVATWQASCIPCSLDEEVGKERHLFLLHHHEQNDQQENQIRREIARSLATFFFADWEKTWIHKLLCKQLSPALRAEKNELAQSLYQKCSTKRRWLYALIQHLDTYLSEENCLALDGYLYFRFPEYRSWIEKKIGEVIDEYVLEKEYREFIQLLRYFIAVQPAKYALIHVVHREKNQFQLFREDGFPLQYNEMDQSLQEMSELRFSHEDLMMSALLSTAPERIIVHTKFPEKNVIQTLLQIFAERITLCSGCQTCERQSHS